MGKLVIWCIIDVINVIDLLLVIKSWLVGYGVGDIDLVWSCIIYWCVLFMLVVD